ncbi:carbamoyltransferase HypF [Clostridium sp. A1-XYC3]|uniref:Carbamoyltransferase n=1 Tax=Clostridium tanneri TaxID=3037988 RepID=A0ABU4JY60_9CLOT|nr:carbamoyltransferase HypF [Clostridium sp. A1-XYC3]MDW8803109.1 carbamoyltransferase HypF [Clostridium sp. A1-XYC3]
MEGGKHSKITGMKMRENEGYKSYSLKIYGIVQGVGFRPFIYKKAKEFAITGWVNNAGGIVVIHFSGAKENIKNFMLSIVKKPPELSNIEKIECKALGKRIYSDFTIKKSTEALGKVKFVSTDVATCHRCVEDIKTLENNRYRYAFTNCTDCGPRYSIIKKLPYDRKSTTMKSFEMCDQCREEYNNPLSRRFHAQPNCCGKCGPSITLMNNKKEVIKCIDPVETTIKLLKQGKIIAIKGIGGFHLVCDGKNEAAINVLRNRKRRAHKPLAVMMKDLSVARKYCMVSKVEEDVLSNNKRPIVLINKRENCSLPENIAPMQRKIGAMLPYTPLHYILFEKDLEILVMTSANISGGYMQYKNKEALCMLEHIADYFLLHNRDIEIPVDDSVVKVINGEEVMIRCGRGYAPYTLNLGVKDQIAALGAEQKNTFALSKDDFVYLSQYTGDLKDLNSYINYKYVFKHLSNLLDINPQIIVQDLHPDYIVNDFAEQLKGRKILVQHHYAHMVSCMAENYISEKVIGVIYDGTGLGTDGAIWGGEFLVGTRNSFERVGHFKYVDIQGGDKAIREPWRCAFSYLYSLGYGKNDFIENLYCRNHLQKPLVEEIEAVESALEANFNCYKTSSVGRLFDCVSSLIGIRNYITYDAQGAIELENIIDSKVLDCYEYNIYEKDGTMQIQYEDIIEGIIRDLKKGIRKEVISAKFHNTIIRATCDLVGIIRTINGINKVVLSGGVFENEFLLKGIYNGLLDGGFEVFYNKKIPTNDGGISFGQLASASSIINEEGIREDVSCHTRKSIKY